MSGSLKGRYLADLDPWILVDRDDPQGDVSGVLLRANCARLTGRLSDGELADIETAARRAALPLALPDIAGMLANARAAALGMPKPERRAFAK